MPKGQQWRFNIIKHLQGKNVTLIGKIIRQIVCLSSFFVCT